MTGPAGAQRGFSLLELVVVIVLIGTLMVMAIWRLGGYTSEAERVALLSMESTLRNALMLEAAARLVAPANGALDALAHTNPMELMVEPPANYLGVLPGRSDPDVPVRHWFFDSDRNRLVYRPGAVLKGISPRAGSVSYDVRIAYEDRDGNGRYATGVDRLYGVRLFRELDHVL